MASLGRGLRWGIAVAACAALACGGGGGGGGGGGEGSAGTCQAPSGRLTQGEYIVTNDTYMNTEATPPAHPITDFSQCANVRAGSQAGTLKASWTWSWPHAANQDEAITRATPSVIYGFKPWDAASSTSNLPRLVTEITSLTVDADVTQTQSAGEISDFGIVTYLTTSGHKTGNDPLPFEKRFFIYRNRYGTGVPATPTAAKILIDGIDWDLVVTDFSVLYYPHADRDVPATSLHLDVAHFLADALARGAIEPSWFVASVETAEILYEGEGSLTLDNYKVQVGTAPLTAHDRPARTALRVWYGAGPDGKYDTADDVVSAYNKLVFQGNGETMREAWFTAEDVPVGAWSQPGGVYGFDLSDPGADGSWFTSDDVVAKYFVRTLDQNGAEVRRVTYVGPGADGIWFTADDVIDPSGYLVRTDSGENNRWGSWDRQVSYVAPGSDGSWLTDDDVIGSYRTHAFGDGAEYWTAETTYDAGPDGIWFNADDRVTGVIRATNTY